MSQVEMILHFGLEEGRNADALVAGEALIAWVELTRAAAAASGSTDTFTVELLSAERSSLRFTHLLRKIDNTLANIKAGAGEYPHLAAAGAALASIIALAGLDIVKQVYFMPDQTVNLSEEDRAILRDIPERVAVSPTVKKKTETFFRVIEKDSAIKYVGVAEGRDQPPIFTIPREQFAERGGLWTMPPDPAVRERIEEFEVVLLRPDLRSSPHTWSFRQLDGSVLDATMTDINFLALLGGPGIPARLKEGITMRIVIVWEEREESGDWKYIRKTRKVIRVLSPTPESTPPTPLFPHSP